jgi:predicted nucleic acid-binding protein
VIVVSDTSPINYLVLIGAIEVLPRLFDKIYVPPQVLDELRRSNAPEVVRHWANAPPDWLQVSTPASTLETSIRLDPGEAQAIALALELKIEAILIDERKGYRVAKERGLTPVGTLTVLEFAAEQKLLDLAQALSTLRSTTFHITDEYIRAALVRDAARRKQ